MKLNFLSYLCLCGRINIDRTYIFNIARYNQSAHLTLLKAKARNLTPENFQENLLIGK